VLKIARESKLFASRLTDVVWREANYFALGMSMGGSALFTLLGGTVSGSSRRSC
jgi:hypothetical protein